MINRIYYSMYLLSKYTYIQWLCVYIQTPSKVHVYMLSVLL